MPNRTTDALFQLIQSLERAEKRNFKLYMTRNSGTGNLKVVQLFDALDKMTQYDEALLLKKTPSIQKQQLSNLKAHLYQEILASVRLLKQEENIDLQLHEQLDFARILYNKGLNIQSLKILEKVKELAKANTDIETQGQIVKGKSDSLSRTVFKSPVRGIVKEINVMTLGGVVAQNGKLMTLVPLDEKLPIEARISPRDIAFIHPGQEALVKVTAYDYSIYGGLKGKVTVISPDTIRDEVKQDQFYYRVYIQTNSDKLNNKAGQQFSITPGMVATVDIKTGQKSVLDYLIKPFNKAQEALRER